MTMDRNAVMTGASLAAPPHPNTEAVFRSLKGDADWRQSFDLVTAIHAGEADHDARFLTAMTASQRSLTEAGHGERYGAFLNGRLVAQLGLISVSSGLARYQNVETHPGARRRGLAGTLVWQADSAALDSQASGQMPRCAATRSVWKPAAPKASADAMACREK
jgi:hypothetical protein